MHIIRSHYLTTLHQAIENKKSLILLDGGRGSGKTTLLKDILADHTLSQKKYYFSFDEDIVSKKFKHCDDFIGYMQIKYGIDFQQPNILLLNEIQYSKNILHLMYEFLSYHFATQIIATGVLPKEDPYYYTLLTIDTVETITVYPFSFFDFLAQKNIYTDYLSLSKPSQVVFREIQSLFDEYLIR